MWNWWRERKRRLELEVRTLYLAGRDPRTPWHAKALAGLVVAYAWSPIDLIPDFIPLVGQLDDLVLVPLGLIVVRRMIPAPILAESRARAQAMMSEKKPRNWMLVAVVVLAVWVVGAAIVVWLVVWMLGRAPHR